MLSQPRIGHLVSLKNLGGVERHFSRFFNDMIKTGNDYHLLPMTDTLHPIVQEELHDHSLRIHSIKGPRGVNLPKQIPWLRPAYQRKLLKTLSLEQLVIWNKYRNFPIALPDDLPIVHFERGSAWFIEPAPDVQRYVKRWSGVICNSHASLRMLQLKLGLPEECPALVARNAMMLPQMTATHDGEAFRLGFAGRLTALKAPVIALETIRLLREKHENVELHVAGDGPLRQPLEALAIKWGLDDVVTFHGPVKDMPSFYCKLDAFICPSWREPFGNVVQEALAHGVPAIVGNVDGLPEQVIAGENGAVLPAVRPIAELGKYDPAFIGPEVSVYSPDDDDIVTAKVISHVALAEILDSWITRPELRREMGNRARQILSERFDYSQYCAAVGDFLDRLARGEDGRA
ncbi:glycosyltransferase [Cobetia sp. MC34]|uniref:glycosyltransferase n=1 Tax=Cobetia sp. MC34 TaxID=2785080 RepID=UPI001BCA1898|nr:glycosyltransferase [Cobetia sp. MC34]MBS4154866.1 glycosyltransferase [Cobetia sp. MC34]